MRNKNKNESSYWDNEILSGYNEIRCRHDDMVNRYNELFISWWIIV